MISGTYFSRLLIALSWQRRSQKENLTSQPIRSRFLSARRDRLSLVAASTRSVAWSSQDLDAWPVRIVNKSSSTRVCASVPRYDLALGLRSDANMLDCMPWPGEKKLNAAVCSCVQLKDNWSVARALSKTHPEVAHTD